MAQMTRLVLTASVGLALSGGLFAAAPTVSTEDVVDKIDSPWDMAFMKDGTMFFTEKCKGLSVRLPSGAINKLHGVGTTTGYSSASADLFCDGQAGMMGVAIDPQFASNRFIYVYSSSNLGGKLGNRVMRFKLNDAMTGVSDRTDIVADIGYKPKATKHPFGGPGAHNGGRIRFSPADGFLYVTTGDNHLGTAPQGPTYIGGKVLRIDRDGKAAPDNKPPAGFDPRVFTYGHRNPQGLAFRPSDNRPFTAENGPWHSDEVTALVNGGNAGWDPRPNMAGRKDCSDDYCGYSPNQMGAMDPKTARGLHAHDRSQDLSEGDEAGVEQQGAVAGHVLQRIPVGRAVEGLERPDGGRLCRYRHSRYSGGQPPGSAEDQCRWVVCNEDRFPLADGRRTVPCL